MAARGEFQLNAARRTLRAIKGSELVFVHYIHVSIDEPKGSYEQLNIARGGTDQGGSLNLKIKKYEQVSQRWGGDQLVSILLFLFTKSNKRTVKHKWTFIKPQGEVVVL